MDKHVLEKNEKGLLSILEKIVDEGRALAIIALLEEALGPSPFDGDPVIEPIDNVWRKKFYAIADPKRMRVIRARIENGRLILMEIIAWGIPSKVEKIDSPTSVAPLYRVVWDNPPTPSLTFGPNTMEGIIRKLKINGWILHYRIAKPVLRAIIEGYVKKSSPPATRIDAYRTILKGFSLLSARLS